MKKAIIKKASKKDPLTISGQVERYLSYREAWARIKQASEQGFYLEAIAIAESIIADRLNTYLELCGSKTEKPFTPLSARVNAVKKLRPEPISIKGFDDLLTAISAWSKERNSAIHSIAARRQDRRESIEQYLRDATATSASGARLARATNDWVASEKKKFEKSLEELPANGFRRMQAKLRELGWLVEWNMPCCQSCAWSALPIEHETGPFSGETIDLSKVLFNHSQDCEYYPTSSERTQCSACDGNGWLETSDDECQKCHGRGVIYDFDTSEYDTSAAPCHSMGGLFVCHHPEQTNNSLFCFDGSRRGIKNLQAVMPLIEACGCTVEWDGKGTTRPRIRW